MIYVVLRPENLLPVAAYRDHEQARRLALNLRGEVAAVDLHGERLLEPQDDRTFRRHDTELLDYLQAMLDERRFTGRAILRWSVTGRGFRLHETDDPDATPSIRDAIEDMLRRDS